MARMTASDMITLVRLGISETSETLSDTQILRLLNQSYLELAGSIDHRELDASTSITTTANTASERSARTSMTSTPRAKLPRERRCTTSTAAPRGSTNSSRSIQRRLEGTPWM